MLIAHKDLKNSYGVVFSKQKDKLQLVGIHLTQVFLSRLKISLGSSSNFNSLEGQGAPHETL